MKAARDRCGATPRPLHCANQLFSAVRDTDVASTLGDYGLGQTCQRRHSRPKALLKIEFSVHRASRNLCHLAFSPGSGGKELYDLVLDKGGVDIENDEKLCQSVDLSCDHFGCGIANLTTSPARLSGSPVAPRPWKRGKQYDDHIMASVLSFTDVTVTRSGNTILDSVSWSADDSDRWVILGPNGAGKTTLLQLAAAQIHPSAGEVTVLDSTLGSSDVFDVRPRIGFASTALARRVPGNERVIDVVLTAAYSVTGRWNEQYENVDIRRARRVLAEWSLSHLEERRFGDLSDGEQKRVQIARSVMTDPELLLLDEPAASLDLGAREELVQLLSGYAQADTAPAIVMVTHHVEEIPRGFTHALVLTEGSVHSAGKIEDIVTSENLSAAFGLELIITKDAGRYTARAA